MTTYCSECIFDATVFFCKKRKAKTKGQYKILMIFLFSNCVLYIQLLNQKKIDGVFD